MASNVSNSTETIFCFIPDANEVFVIAKVLPALDASYDHSLLSNLRKICDEDSKRPISVEVVADLLPSGAALSNKATRRTVLAHELVPIDSIWELQNPPSDLIKLMYVQRPTILYTLRQRFMRDEIYTAIGPILVAINPFKWIDGIYSTERKMSFQDGSAELSDQPHVFAVAHDALKDLQLMRRSQSLIIRCVREMKTKVIKLLCTAPLSSTS